MSAVPEGPRVTLQFHPDWPFSGGLVIEAMARDRAYRSQFVTGTSNGGLTAFPGGDRWCWESRLFEGRYEEGPASARPVYGAWNRRDDPYGGAIRFGSAHLRLRPNVVERSTFCSPTPRSSPSTWVARSCCRTCPSWPASRAPTTWTSTSRRTCTVASGSTVTSRRWCWTRASATARSRPRRASSAAHSSGIPVSRWPPRAWIRTTADPYVTLAGSLADVLTPDVIGDAARTGRHDPQALKRVWHLLAHVGR